MELTYYTDFALRVLLYAAAHGDRRVTMREVAGAYRISQEHLRKVVHRLARNGYLETIQGRSGGLCLGRPASDIYVGEIVELMEDSLQLIHCGREPCPLCGSCSLKSILDEARDHFLARLNLVSLAQLLGDPETEAQLRQLPAVLPTDSGKG